MSSCRATNANAVPGNECDWEDGVCDACRERREAPWTHEDTAGLRNVAQNVTYRGFKAETELEFRAAAHIEALESRIATLEAERADTIPRAALVIALRSRCSSCGGNRYVHGYDGSEEGYQEECPGCHHSDAYDIADEIERGEWPGEGER